MSLLARFLIGRRDAILTLADARGALWLSIGLVMTAALARRYDQADLSHAPWLLLMPLVISGLNGSILALWWRVIPARGAERPPLRTEWRRTVTLFWMTAPLAWLYGIPWERFLDPVTAVKVNAYTLLVVAIWRVLLTARFLSVLSGVTFGRSLFVLMVFADVVAVALTAMAPKPMISIMGGIPHSPVDAAIAESTASIIFLGILSFPIWVIFAVAAAATAKPRWPRLSPARTDRSAWLPVLVAGIVCSVPMFWTQPEQRLARRIDGLLADEQIAEAVDLIASHDPQDLPPHFDPRPRYWPDENSPDLWLVLEVLAERDPTPEWVRQMWLEKARRSLESFGWRSEDEGLDREARILAAFTEGRQMMREHLERGNAGEDVERAFRRALSDASPR